MKIPSCSAGAAPLGERVGLARAIGSATAMLGLIAFAAAALPSHAEADTKRPNIVMLMTDDTGWNDFGAYSGGGVALGHPTPSVDRIAKEGATFTSWYGQASCTAGRASFITGRIPIRSALSIVVAPGDRNYLRKETPTIAEFFKKNGYATYFSGKWHLGDQPDSYPIEHGFDEMKHFAAYYAGVYAYNDISSDFHPWFPNYNQQFNESYNKIVNLGEWEGVAGQAGKADRHHHLRLHGRFRHPPDRLGDRVHQEPREGRQAVLHGHQLSQDAQPDQRGAAVPRQVAPRRLFRQPDGARLQYRPHHGCDPRRGSRHHRHPDSRQWCLAGRVAGCWNHAVPGREGLGLRRRLARSGPAMVAGACPGRRPVSRDDDAYRCLGHARRHGWPDAAASRMDRQ